MHFLALPSVEVAKQRVKFRVQQGGHDIPSDVIERRFKRGLHNFFNIYKNQVDEWVLYNAISQQQQIIAYQEKKLTTILLPDKWTELEEQQHD
ncbi:MAG: hypothetical protein WCK96_04380 [Methylococcales bacterium]